MNKLLLLNSSGLVKILKKDNTNTATILIPPSDFFKPVEILYKNFSKIFKRKDYKFIKVYVYDIINTNINLEYYLIFYKLVTDEKDIGRFGIMEKINDKDETINFISEKVKLSDIEEIYYIY